MFLHIVQICFDCSNIICGIGPSTVNDERLAKTGETEMDQSGERMPKYTNTFSMISYPYFTIPYHNLPHQNQSSYDDRMYILSVRMTVKYAREYVLKLGI